MLLNIYSIIVDEYNTNVQQIVDAYNKFFDAGAVKRILGCVANIILSVVCLYKKTRYLYWIRLCQKYYELTLKTLFLFKVTTNDPV